jgi:hypothetical protein
MTALGRDLPVAEYLSSVAMNVFDGGDSGQSGRRQGFGQPGDIGGMGAPLPRRPNYVNLPTSSSKTANHLRNVDEVWLREHLTLYDMK